MDRVPDMVWVFILVILLMIMWVIAMAKNWQASWLTDEIDTVVGAIVAISLYRSKGEKP